MRHAVRNSGLCATLTVHVLAGTWCVRRGNMCVLNAPLNPGLPGGLGLRSCVLILNLAGILQFEHDDVRV